ncbi:MAG TPA: PilC/PilY family type IV pilus protein, partial [Gammaproteobacteria bacterium]
LFQVSQQEDDSDAAIEASKANGGMAGIARGADFPTVISWMNDIDLSDGVFGVKNGGDANGDGVIDSKYDRDGDGYVDPEFDLAGMQNVTSYFISEKNTQTVKEYAVAGGTNNPLPLTGDPEQLIDTLTDIFTEILSVSTTFVAASVPVNVFNRAESLDNVFIALFQAEEEPFWNGNLKKLKLKTITGDDGSDSLALVDANNQLAIASQDGRIKFDALTYWTEADMLPPPTPDTEEVALRDGRVIDRGAAGQQIPGFITSTVGLTNGAAGTEPPDNGPRKVLYETTAGAVLQDLNADATVAAALKAKFGATVTDAQALDYITWLRGIDPVTDTRRPWLLGDPLHSRPLPINFGARGEYTEDNPLIYIAMASNDGYMHFFKNTEPSLDANGDPVESGKEVWAFVPTDVMDTVPRLVANNPGDPKHPYTVDGAPSAYLDDANGDGTISSGENAYLYFGLRRGGRIYYALDISNPNAPELAWKISNATAGFEELGYTFSRPQVGMIDYDGDTIDDPEPVVIFAGGYDLNKDRRGVSVTDAELNDSMGRAVYIVHAVTGDLVWKVTYGTTTGGSGSSYAHAGMVDSIPSDVTAVDTNGDQQIDRILVGDTGGKVWRIDTFGDRENWQATILANLGRHHVADSTNDRRFFHRPDFVQAQEKLESVILNPDGTETTVTTIEKFDAVIIGSGDRPNPLDAGYASGSQPVNWLYMIRDTRILPAKASPDPAYEVNDLDTTHATLGDITDPATGAATNDGWKLKLGITAGEKSLSSPLTLSNVVYFTTYLPNGFPDDEGEADLICGPDEGAGALYAVNLLNGKAALNYNSTDDNEEGTESASDRYKKLSSAGIPADVVSVTVDGQAHVLPPDLSPEDVDAATRWRTFWYEVEDSEL